MQAADTITPSSGDPGLGSFLRRVLGFLCIALVVLALWRLADVVILVFGAVLLAWASTAWPGSSPDQRVSRGRRRSAWSLRSG